MGTEKTEPACLPPEAYLRIIRACENQVPKFRSTVYPQKKTKKEKK